MENATPQTVTINVEGMNCGRCVSAVTAAVSRVDNIELKRVVVGQVDVVIRDSRSLADVIDAIREAGYESHPAANQSAANPQTAPQCCTSKA